MTANPAEIYRSMMLEVKIRIRAVDCCLEESNNQLSPLDVEYCFLQIRKIVEHVCFASFLCDESRYKDFRTLEGLTDDEDKGNYERDWNSRIILDKLNDISPHFMPIPLGDRKTQGNLHHFERKNIDGTHKALVKIYKRCGSFMHVPKPFGDSYESYLDGHEKRDQAASQTIIDYVKYLKDLLWDHAAVGLLHDEGDDPLDPATPQTAWIKRFGDYKSDAILLTIGVGEQAHNKSSKWDA